MKIFVLQMVGVRGYTLIEIMFSIGIIAILSSMAIPSFSTTLTNASINSTRQLLLQDIRQLRSYVRTQAAPGYLCALNQQGDCERKSRWDNGWRGFVDNNHNRKFDEGDVVILEHLQNNTGNISVFIHTRWKNIKIDRLGLIRSSGHFRVCDPNKTAIRSMKIIRMNVHGRLGEESDNLGCG